MLDPSASIPERSRRSGTIKPPILKSKPGREVKHEPPVKEDGVFPIFHCYQEVPCNPCTSVCPVGAVKTEGDRITGLPYVEDLDLCTGCAGCVAVCPGLSVTLVDYREDRRHPLVTLPYEVWRDQVQVGQKVPVTDLDGAVLGYYAVEKVKSGENTRGTLLVQVRLDKAVAKAAVGIWVQEKQIEPSTIYEKEPPPDEAIVCRCERVTAGEIRAAVRSGIRDYESAQGPDQGRHGRLRLQNLPAHDLADISGGRHRFCGSDRPGRPAPFGGGAHRGVCRSFEKDEG